MRKSVLRMVEQERIIAIVRGVEPSKCLKTAEALYQGGIRLLEVTYDQSAPESWPATAGAIRQLAQVFAGKLAVGAGTVTTPELVDLTKEAGGLFVISPDTNAAVIQRTRELDLVSIPGAMTPSEILEACRAGADLVKVFPASVLGPAYFKAAQGPLSHVKLMAVGGVNEKNITEFLAAGAVGAGIGGNLANRVWIDKGEFQKLTETARALTDNVRAFERGRGK